jgi:hypothetical protein
MELTEKQKKTLKLFSNIARSYGSNIVWTDVSYYDTSSVDDVYFNNFYDKDDGSSLEKFDQMDDLVKFFSKTFSKEVYSEMNDNDSQSGELYIEVDCVKKLLTLIINVEVTVSDTRSFVEDIENNKTYKSLFQYMEERNYDVATVTFEGGGDSGYIDSSISFDGDTGSGRAPISQFNIEDHLYDLLEAGQPGWETDDGSAGHFTIDANEKKIYLQMDIYERQMDEAKILGRYEF